VTARSTGSSSVKAAWGSRSGFEESDWKSRVVRRVCLAIHVCLPTHRDLVGVCRSVQDNTNIMTFMLTTQHQYVKAIRGLHVELGRHCSVTKLPQSCPSRPKQRKRRSLTTTGYHRPDVHADETQITHSALGRRLQSARAVAVFDTKRVNKRGVQNLPAGTTLHYPGSIHVDAWFRRTSRNPDRTSAQQPAACDPPPGRAAARASRYFGRGPGSPTAQSRCAHQFGAEHRASA
jgi:hypothetical protein